MINISFKKLKSNVVDEYFKTLKGWRNKDVMLENIHKVMCDSTIQYSPYAWNNGVKKAKQLDRSKQDCVVIDVDDGLSISEFQKLFKKYKFYLATTKSHQKEKHNIVCDRFRVLLPVINIHQDDDVFFRSMELLFPFNDKQTLTKTGAFLGNNDAIFIFNDGKVIDMYSANELAIQQVESEKATMEANKFDKDLFTRRGINNLEIIKEQVTQEVMIDILNSIGVEVVGNKCKLREERTHSVKIYPNGTLYDFGDSKAYDCFGVLVEFNDMNFRDAVQYVKLFI